MRVGSLEGAFSIDTPIEGENVTVECSLYCGQNSLCLPVKFVSDHLDDGTSDELLISSKRPDLQFCRVVFDGDMKHLPLFYSELQRDAELRLTVKVCDAVIGGCKLSLFTDNGILRKGSQRLLLQENASIDGKNVKKDEIDRINKAVRKYERGEMTKVGWLDQLTFSEIDRVKQKALVDGRNVHLIIQLAKFDFPVIFKQLPYKIDICPAPIGSNVYDPEMYRENLSEAKHRRMVRSHRTTGQDRDLKPNAKIRDQLMLICQKTSMTSTEADLVWKFRFYLTRYKFAMSKFIKAVDWSDQMEQKQVLDILLPLYGNMDAGDILELLGPANRYVSVQALRSMNSVLKDSIAGVRKFAVQCLEHVNDEELLIYLPQLVKVIQYEDLSVNVMGGSSSQDSLKLKFKPGSAQSRRSLTGTYESALVEFLITRSVKNAKLGNCLYWYLQMAQESGEQQVMYAKVSYFFMSRVVDFGGSHVRDAFHCQTTLIERLVELTKELRAMKESRPKKIAWLKDHVSDVKNAWLEFDEPFPLPLDPSYIVYGIIPDDLLVFKSHLMPIRLTFRASYLEETSATSTYTTIFKLGDDLRQDQLILQLISLMDRILRKENMDLKLTPYKVLATGMQHGLIQFIPSTALAAILQETGGSLLNWMRKIAPSVGDTDLNVDPVFMDTYIKSCAGYCVITYILGIGDRHLDNLLITDRGCLFHIDFSYILGKDPKPFPPPMKISKEMVEAMGGLQSQQFQRFKSLCQTSFMILRRSSHAILNVLLLSNQQDSDVSQLLQDKFKLELSEEEAIQYLAVLINESMSALFPQILESIHKYAQYWRR